MDYNVLYIPMERTIYKHNHEKKCKEAPHTHKYTQSKVHSLWKVMFSLETGMFSGFTTYKWVTLFEWESHVTPLQLQGSGSSWFHWRNIPSEPTSVDLKLRRAAPVKKMVHGSNCHTSLEKTRKLYIKVLSLIPFSLTIWIDSTVYPHCKIN